MPRTIRHHSPRQSPRLTGVFLCAHSSHSAHARTIPRPHVRRSSAGAWQDNSTTTTKGRQGGGTLASLDNSTARNPAAAHARTASPIDCSVSIITGRAGAVRTPTQSKAQHNNNKEHSEQHSPTITARSREVETGEYTHNNSRNIFRISPLRDPSTPGDDASH